MAECRRSLEEEKREQQRLKKEYFEVHMKRINCRKRASDSANVKKRPASMRKHEKKKRRKNTEDLWTNCTETEISGIEAVGNDSSEYECTVSVPINTNSAVARPRRSSRNSNRIDFDPYAFLGDVPK